MCLKMLEKELKTTASLFSVTSKIFVNHVNNNIVNHLKKYGLISDFYGFRPYHSTADLLTVVSDKIARAFNIFGASQGAPLDVSRTFDSLIYHARLYHKLKSYGIFNQLSTLSIYFSIIGGFVWFWIVSLCKSTLTSRLQSQSYLLRKIPKFHLINCVFPQNFHTRKLGEVSVFYAVTFFQINSNDFLHL